MADIFDIAGRINSTSQEKVVTTADQIKDETQNKKQNTINADVARHENEIHGTGGIDSRLSDVEQMEQIVIDGGEAQIATGSDFDNPDATKRAKIPTVGAIIDSADDGVFDVSVKYPTSGIEGGNTYTLEGALTVLNSNLPANKKKGGMSIKFIHSSDNKYVQYRCIADEFTTDITQWAICGNGIYTDNPEFAIVWKDNTGKILFGIQKDNNFFFGCGCPQQVKNYVKEQINIVKQGTAGTDIDGVNKIIDFLNDFSTSDTLKELLDEKVDKESGKGLIQDEVAESISVIENPEYMNLETDENHKILGGRRKDGTKIENMPIELPSATIKSSNNPEWLQVCVDKNGRIIKGIKKNGTLYPNVDKTEKIPYYYKDYIKNKAIEINSMLDESGINGDTFVFVTDYHRQGNTKHSASLVEYLLDNTGVSRVVFGGDAQDYEETFERGLEETVGFKLDYKDVWGRMFSVIGNHEFNSHYHRIDPEHYPASIMLTTNQIYGLMMKDKEVGYKWLNDLGYYAFDNDIQKIRYFVVGCDYWCYLPPNAAGSLIEAFEDVPDGYNIVILTHLTIQYSKQWGATVEATMRPITDALDALNNRTEFEGTYTYPEQIGGGTYTFTADYRGSKASAFCVIGGHMHDDLDLAYPYSGIYAGVPIHVIATTTDAYARQDHFVTKYTRIKGSVSEQAFDVFHLDIKNKMIYAKRIGAGYDRIYHQNVYNINIGETVTLTPTLSGTLSWGINRSSWATVSNGIVTGVSSGVVFVSCTDSDNNREVFIVKIN